MKTLTDFLTESNMTVDASGLKIGHNKPRTDQDFEELAEYGNLVYDVYVENYGDKVPKDPWQGVKRNGWIMKGAFEKNLHNIVDTSRLDVQSSMFIQAYVFVRLKGVDGDEAIDEAKDLYDRKMQILGIPH